MPDMNKHCMTPANTLAFCSSCSLVTALLEISFSVLYKHIFGVLNV